VVEGGLGAEQAEVGVGRFSHELITPPENPKRTTATAKLRTLLPPIDRELVVYYSSRESGEAAEIKCICNHLKIEIHMAVGRHDRP